MSEVFVIVLAGLGLHGNINSYRADPFITTKIKITRPTLKKLLQQNLKLCESINKFISQ